MAQAREANLKASQLDHINTLLEESKTRMGEHPTHFPSLLICPLRHFWRLLCVGCVSR